MAKDKKDPQATQKNKVSMESKRAQRAAQSKRDSEAARSEAGWVASARTKDKVEFKHRCGRCLNPSAACRRGAKTCTRCNGSAGRSRKRQQVRDGKPATAVADAIKTAINASGAAQ